MKLPKYDVCFTLNHNEHKCYYETAEDYIKKAEERGYGINWPSEEAKQRAIDTNEMWEATWYPRTPVGSYCAAAPTLEELLEFINKPGEWE